MTQQRKLRVFLCHASQDKPAVRDLYQRLLDEGWIDPWLDEEKILPGQDWDLEIEEAVEASDVVIVCLSSRSVSKEGYVQRELKYVMDIALGKPEGTIFIVPLRLDDCQIPRRLRSIQYLDYFPAGARARSFQRVCSSLEVRASSLSLLSKQHDVVTDWNQARERDKKPVGLSAAQALRLQWLGKGVGLLGAVGGLMSYFMPFLNQIEYGAGHRSTGLEITFGYGSYYDYSPALIVIPVICLALTGLLLYSSITGKLKNQLGILCVDGVALIIIVLLGHIPWLVGKSQGLVEPIVGFWILLAGVLLVIIGAIMQSVNDMAANSKIGIGSLFRRTPVYLILLVVFSIVVYYAETWF